MRKYALVILNSVDKIVDRYNLDIVTNPSGNGFKLNLSTISSDIEDIITKVVQQKSVIKFTINQHQNSYLKANSLASWIQKYSIAKYKMALEYDDGNIIRYCEGKVTNLGKTEMDEFKNLAQDFEFTQTTPFFVKRENLITIQVSSVGKSYPFKYPYSYGANVVENNEINNPYILDVPLIITINGAIVNPNVSLLDENGNSYNRVRFGNLSLLQGEQLVINSAQRKIIKILEDGTEEDYAPEVDANYDTFLRAKTGISFISINTEEALEGFKLTGGWRQYTL
jgi:hypothetical protein